jgi:hypothetical protein
MRTNVVSFVRVIYSSPPYIVKSRDLSDKANMVCAIALNISRFVDLFRMTTFVYLPFVSLMTTVGSGVAMVRGFAV